MLTSEDPLGDFINEQLLAQQRRDMYGLSNLPGVPKFGFNPNSRGIAIDGSNPPAYADNDTHYQLPGQYVIRDNPDVTSNRMAITVGKGEGPLAAFARAGLNGQQSQAMYGQLLRNGQIQRNSNGVPIVQPGQVLNIDLDDLSAARLGGQAIGNESANRTAAQAATEAQLATMGDAVMSRDEAYVRYMAGGGRSAGYARYTSSGLPGLGDGMDLLGPEFGGASGLGTVLDPGGGNRFYATVIPNFAKGVVQGAVAMGGDALKGWAMIGDQIVNDGRNIQSIDQVRTRIWDYDSELGLGAGIAGEMLSPTALLKAGQAGAGILGPKLADMTLDALSRQGLVLNAVPEGKDIAATGTLFRGGDSLAARLGVDVKPAADGLIHPLGKNGKPQGLSLNLDPMDPFIQKYGGAFPVNSLPEGLQALQSGKTGHFVVTPVKPMAFETYQELLNRVQLGNFNALP